MRIGHYMRYMFEPGGIASYIRLISGAQIEDGHEVYYFDRQTPGSPPSASAETITYTRDDTDLMNRAAAMKLDVLHVHMVLEAKAIDAARVPLVRTVHTHSPYCPSQGRFLTRRAVACDRNYSLTGCLCGHVFDRCGSLRPAAMLRNFSTVRQELAGLSKITSIAVSQFIKDQMVRAGHRADRIHVMYLPAPAPRPYVPPPREEPVVFAFLGRMIPHKGVPWLLRTMTRVRASVRLELAGTGNQENEYRELAKRLNLGDRVVFRGWLGPEQVQNLLMRARALVYPSLWHEPGALATYEAMAAGRAMILSDVGGLPEISCNQSTGLLVPPGDEHVLGWIIDRLAWDYDLAESIGQAGLDLVTHHRTLAGHMKQLLALYESLS